MDNKPRILYILHSPIAVTCGTELHTKTLFEGLGDKYDTWVVFPHEEALFLSQDGVQANRFPADPVSQQTPPYSSPKTDQSLQTIFSGVKPDLVHIQHFINWPLNVIDRAIETTKPVIISLHDNYAITPEYTMADTDPGITLTPDYAIKTFGKDISPYLKQRRELINNGMKKAVARIVPSAYLARTMSGIFPQEFSVIAHGISAFSTPGKNGGKHGIVFGYIGKLLTLKGWKTLVQAFSDIHTEYPETELHFHGGHPPQHDSSSTPGITFYGGYAQGQLPDILSGIDIVVIPSIVPETFSLVLSEAWMAGVPAIVSSIGALDDRVKEGINGKKFKAGDIDSLRRTMTWFLENDDWKSWDIKKPETREAMLSDYDHLYKDVLKNT